MKTAALQRFTHQTGLDDHDLLLSQGNNRDNEFHGVSEAGVEQTTKGFSDIEGQFLSSKRQHCGEWNDGQEVDDEHHDSAHALDLVQSDTNGDKDQHEVDPGSKHRLDLRANCEFRVLLFARLGSVSALEFLLVFVVLLSHEGYELPHLSFPRSSVCAH